MNPRHQPQNENERLKRLLAYEQAARQRGFRHIVGVDEAGRGPLAGPVVAAACHLPEGWLLDGVDDSKKLTRPVRQRLFKLITGDSQVNYGIGIVSPEVIDTINIFQATIQAMLEAVGRLAFPPDYLLIDGMKIAYSGCPVEKIIHGDALSLSIAAASIIAKETRDQIMEEYDQQWPAYGFAKHKGYGTAQHLEALAKHGPSPIHRRSFKSAIMG